jgi:hypothetical protein
MKIVLGPVADLAGYPLPCEDAEAVCRFFELYLPEIQALRELVLPDEVEPVTQLHMESWD